ncbi:MAG: hypothetical protein Q8O16_01650, partial [Dehalococcoidia bacterium]|nr:hypothetical protein [Dehalococcoidia bacterium]
IDDINKLKSANQTNRAVLFVVFPITIDNKKWEAQLQRISGLLKHIKRDSFKFLGKIPGVLYFGLV